MSEICIKTLFATTAAKRGFQKIVGWAIRKILLNVVFLKSCRSFVHGPVFLFCTASAIGKTVFVMGSAHHKNSFSNKYLYLESSVTAHVFADVILLVVATVRNLRQRWGIAAYSTLKQKQLESDDLELL